MSSEINGNMSNDIINAKEIFDKGQHTCVLYRGGDVYTSAERGVKPLIDMIEGGTDLNGFSACDKVVGKAAAFLYVLMGVKEVYAETLSESAARIFEKYNIKYDCGVSAAVIFNRSGDGMCPMEQTVLNIEDPDEAFKAIQLKLSQIAG